MSQRRAAALALLAVLLAGYLFFLMSGGSVVQLQPDDGYEAASRFTRLDNVLSYHRTFAYPLFLRAVRALSPTYAALPHLQALLFLVAIAGVHAALVRTGVAPWTAFFASAPLVANPLLTEHASYLLSDTVGGALMLAVIASVLLVRIAPSVLGDASLTVFVFLAYQTRPALLFLVVLVPLMSAVLPGRRPARVLRIAACCVLPLLAFCAFRWSINGEFGVVSFGGYSAVGVSGSLLSPETISRLSPDLQGLATTLYQRRLAEGHGPIQDRAFPSARARYEAWFAEVNSNVWRVAARPAFEEARTRYRLRFPQPATATTALPAATRDAQRQAFLRWRAEGRRWSRLEANRLLSRLSWQLVRQQPALYAQWVVQGLRHVAARAVAVVPMLGISAVLVLAALLLPRLHPKARRGRGVPEERAGACVRRFSAACSPLLISAVGVALASVLVAVLLHRPLDRYLASAVLLLPGSLAALAWERLRPSSRPW